MLIFSCHLCQEQLLTDEKRKRPGITFAFFDPINYLFDENACLVISIQGDEYSCHLSMY